MTQTAPREDTRARLIAAARTVISRSGLQTARMEDIAAEAGVSRAALYYHFNSKQDLAAALVDDIFRGLTATVRAALAEGPIEHVLRAAVEFFDHQVTLARLLIADMPTPVDPDHLGARHRDELLGLLRERLRADMDRGTVRRCDPEVASMAIATLMRVAPMCLVTGAAVDHDHLMTELSGFVRHALAPAVNDHTTEQGGG
jgi:AcrR family transcriptional regulator